MSDGQELAIKRAFSHWRVYAVSESERFGRYATVLRDDQGTPHIFSSEAAARAYIESVPDATEVDYPA
jgi:hypothetical protein